MKPITKEWIEKAEGDYHTASREFAVRDYPNYDAVCFHAQQCVEKYLKAKLQELEIPFGKTHNLTALMELLLAQDDSWRYLLVVAQGLMAFSVEVRYPGMFADRNMAADALKMCGEFRQQARLNLGLS